MWHGFAPGDLSFWKASFEGYAYMFHSEIFCETDYLVGGCGEEMSATLLCSAAASFLLHNTRLPLGWPFVSYVQREGGWGTARDGTWSGVCLDRGVSCLEELRLQPCDSKYSAEESIWYHRDPSPAVLPHRRQRLTARHPLV